MGRDVVGSGRTRRFSGPGSNVCAAASNQGLTLVHLRAQLEELRDTSLTLELNLSTFGTHPRVIWGSK